MVSYLKMLDLLFLLLLHVCNLFRSQQELLLVTIESCLLAGEDDFMGEFVQILSLLFYSVIYGLRAKKKKKII